jgi:hypothetical protein
MPDEKLEEIADFVEFLDAKRRRLAEEREKEEGGDSFAMVIGICEGPSDLAERHDKYVYGGHSRIFQ